MKMNEFFFCCWLFEENEADNSCCSPVKKWTFFRCLFEADSCDSPIGYEWLCSPCWSIEEDEAVGSCCCSSVEYDVVI